MITKFLKDISTEDDAGTIFCFVRVLSLIGGIVLMSLLVYATLIDYKSFNIEQSGRALMEYLVGVGVAIWGKTKSGA